MPFDRMRLTKRLAAIVADAPHVAELPRRVCEACRDALPVDGVGLSLMDDDIVGGCTLLGASDPIGTHIEELQFSLGEGPCTSAFRDHQPVFVPDLAAAEATVRWPMFTHAVAALGVSAIFAFPLQLGASSLGVLDCHRSRPGPLLEIMEGLLVADAVAMALLSYELRTRRGAAPGPDLYELSWHQHAEVHLAIGVVAGQLDIPAQEALDLLRAYAYEHDQSMNQVADDVVTLRLRLADEP